MSVEDRSLDISPQGPDLSGDLLDGETVVWTGQPNPNQWFSPGDIVMVPFSLMWGGFAFFWEANVLGLLGKHGKSAPRRLSQAAAR